MNAEDMRHPLTLRERPQSGPVEAVIFDWGGTLAPWPTIDLGPQWRIFAREVNGVPIDSDDVAEEDLARARELGARISTVWQEVEGNQHKFRLDDILARAGANAREDRHHVALAAHRRFWEPRIEINPQVRPLWLGLRGHGLRVGVLSNTIWSRDYHRDVFERGGVAELIDAEVYSSETHVAKPQPEAFEAACAALGVTPTNAVHVGDRLFEDVLGAQEIGMRAIWVPHGDTPADQQITVDVTPDGVAAELLDVLGIVETWLSETT